MVSLIDKWALVTGASRGIGKITSLSLAEQGCNVVLHSRRTENLKEVQEAIEKMGVKVFPVAENFMEEGAVDRLLGQIEAQGISVDILINNAGVNLSIERENSGISSAFDKWTQKEYETTMRVNTVVPTLLAVKLSVKMRQRGFGRIVNLTSDIHGASDHLIYSISKGAIDKMTRDLAEIMEGSGVAVSAVEPGWCQTFLGGEGAMCPAENTSPGMLVPVCMEQSVNGKTFHAQEFANMTLREAVAWAEQVQPVTF